MTQHERPTVLSSEPKDLTAAENLRWAVALGLLVVVGAAVAIGLA